MTRVIITKNCGDPAEIYVFDRVAKAVAQPPAEECAKEWSVRLEQLQDDSLEALDAAEN